MGKLAAVASARKGDDETLAAIRTRLNATYSGFGVRDAASGH